MNKEQNPQAENNKPAEPFESDAKKLANQHMADPHHIITEEDMRNIRVGVTPPPDGPTQEAINEADDRIADRKKPEDNKTLPGSQKITPWDVVD
ncbi:MAG TPA: hypothetical protein VGN63_15630 [Flavisolibacter sp.]|jgi:hypothetical protein|nr:hypothetical protein [Flavisolibacter sp.]